MWTKVNQLIEQYGDDSVVLPKMEVGQHVLGQIADYVKVKKFEHAIVVVDEQTNRAAGESVTSHLIDNGIKVDVVTLQPNKYGQVIADEQTLIQLMVETPSTADVLLAVGAGTIHDVVRFAGDKMRIPFISVPTAASVDGFTSKGAPLILRGFKQTIQTTAPIAVFADTNVLQKAPKELTAAGFGDILGKYTSLLDWKISQLIGKEPYNELAAEVTRQSLENCITHVDEIAEGTDKGLKTLMDSLLVSGLVMLVLNHSRPASGAEHHLSHYWEMDLLKKDKEQLLHGAKVGVATILITKLYQQMAKTVEKDSFPAESVYHDAFHAHWDEVKLLMKELPSADYLSQLLSKINGPTTPSALSISDELVQSSLNEAYQLRERCTGLLLYNLVKTEKIEIPL